MGECAVTVGGHRLLAPHGKVKAVLASYRCNALSGTIFPAYVGLSPNSRIRAPSSLQKGHNGYASSIPNHPLDTKKPLATLHWETKGHSS